MSNIVHARAQRLITCLHRLTFQPRPRPPDLLVGRAYQRHPGLRGHQVHLHRQGRVDHRACLRRQDHSPVGLVGRPLGAQLPPQWLRVKVRGMLVR